MYMAEQNIYDNEAFFEGYHKLRERDDNANVLFEMPALFSLLPELKGKNVLDLGCGFGEHCMHMAQAGACKVVGIDISEKMLQVARAENAAPNIVYYQRHPGIFSGASLQHLLWGAFGGERNGICKASGKAADHSALPRKPLDTERQRGEIVSESGGLRAGGRAGVEVVCGGGKEVSQNLFHHSEYFNGGGFCCGEDH